MTSASRRCSAAAPYERRAWLARRDVDVREYLVRTGGAAPEFPTVAAALTQWQADGRPNATITILDSRTYTLPAGITLSSLRPPDHRGGERRAAACCERAWPRASRSTPTPCRRPIPPLRGALTLCGLLVEGFVHVVGDVGPRCACSTRRSSPAAA